MHIPMASDLFHPFLPGGGEKQMHEIARRLAKNTISTSSLEKVHEGTHIHRILFFSSFKKLKLYRKNFNKNNRYSEGVRERPSSATLFFVLTKQRGL
jgi:hypothetical protein